MFEMMRKVFGPTVVGVIIGAIALVFVFYGVYNPKGSGPGGAAATVNGDTITISEFGREYNSRVEMYQNMMQGKLDMNMLKQFGLRQQVMEGLIQRKLVLQEARKMGIAVADAEIAEKIREMPYFKNKGGQFDPEKYKSVLKANNYSAGQFEETLREDLLRNSLMSFLKGRARVSEEEVRSEFLIKKNQRQVEYVVVTPPKGTPPVKDGKTADDSAKASKALAAALLEKAKKPGELKGFLKAKGLTQKTSDKFSENQAFLAGIGEAQDVVADAFKGTTLPKLYELRAGTSVLVTSVKSFSPNLAELEKEKTTMHQSVANRKEQELFAQWMNDVKAHAKISINKAVQQEVAEN